MSIIRSFIFNDAGASLVEYSVALVVVTIVGGAAALGLGGAAGQMAINSDTVVSSACTQGANAANATPGVATTNC